MQKNAEAKRLRWLGKTNLRNKNSTPTERCQEKTGMFMEANFLAKGADSTLYTAKPLTFLPERRMLFIGLAVNSRKEILYDATRILGES